MMVDDASRRQSPTVKSLARFMQEAGYQIVHNANHYVIFLLCSQ
jgi:hypothetical protein